MIHMQLNARLQAVIDLFEIWEEENMPADALMSQYCKSRKYIGSKDRQFIGNTFFKILRYLGYIQGILKHVKAPLTPRFYVFVYCLKLDGYDIPTLQEGCTGDYGPLEISPTHLLLLEKILKLRDKELDLATQYSIPAFLMKSLEKTFGKDFKPLADSMLDEAPVDLRVNTLKTTRDQVLQDLRQNGFNTTVTSLSPWGIRLTGRPNIMATDLYQQGMIEIQDTGSQLAALATDVKPGMTVLDYCAGAGGKTLALAAMMENKGRLFASDIHLKRLERSKLRLRRAGVHNATLISIEENGKWFKRHAKFFDRVLVDAPCSGSGTWRRNPDLKWKLTPESLKNVCLEQENILNKAASMLKKKGWLIYTTCSLLPEENEDQITKFLNSHPDYSLVPIDKILANEIVLGQSYLKLNPLHHRTDGFFTAVVIRN